MKWKNILYKSRLIAGAALHQPSLLPGRIQPKNVVMKLTENCNAKCVTCDFWRTSRKPTISTERAQQLLTEIHDLGIRQITFSGGEPLLRKDLFALLDHCKENWFDTVILATNGLLINRFAEAINNSNITHLFVSLDGVGKTNDDVRGIDGYYERVVNNLRLVRGKKIMIRSLLTKGLVNDVESLIDYCEENDFTYHVSLLESDMYGFSSDEVKRSVRRLMTSEEETRQVFDILKRRGCIGNVAWQSAIDFATTNDFDFDHCMLAYRYAYILENGDVRSGCFVNEPIGNVLESPLKDVIDSHAHHEAANWMYEKQCNSCTCGYLSSVNYNHPLRYAFDRVHQRLRTQAPKKQLVQLKGPAK